MRELLRRREARLLLAGQILSFFGDSALFLVLGIWAKDLTGSNAAAGLVFFVLALPALAEPLAGYVVDRLPRRLVLMGAHAFLGGAVLLLLFVHDRGDLWLIYVVAFLYGAGAAFSVPARAGLIKAMFGDELLGEANGALQTAREGLRLVAPLAGAALYAGTGGGTVAILDAATFAFSAATVALLRVREPKAEPPEHRFLREVAAGAQHIWTTLPLRQLVLAVAVALVVIGFVETAIFAVVDQGLGRPPSFLGVLEVFQGIGAIAGGVTASRAIRRFGDGRVAGVGLVLFALGDALLVTESLVVVCVGFVIAGAGISWAVVAFGTSLGRRTPHHLQGRVFATASMTFGVPQTFSIALGAVLVTVVDYRLLLLTMAVVTLACGAYLLTRRTFLEAAPDADEPPAAPATATAETAA